MPGLNLSVDTEYMEQLRRELRYTRGGLAKVLERSLNRTLRGVRTDASREIRKEVTAKDKYIKETFKLYRASAKRRILSASIVSRGGSLPLSAYDTRQRKAGVAVKVERGGSSEVIPHTFLARIYRDDKDVYQRKIHSTGGGYTQMRKAPSKRSKAQYAQMPLKYRFPVKKLYGPAVPSIFRREDIMHRLKSKAGERLETELRRQARYEIEKSGIEVTGI